LVKGRTKITLPENKNCKKKVHYRLLIVEKSKHMRVKDFTLTAMLDQSMKPVALRTLELKN